MCTHSVFESSYIFLNKLLLWVSNTLGLSNSTMSPLSSTKTLSQFTIECSLWAIMSIVHSEKISSTTPYKILSVSESILALASSITKNLHLATAALARQTNCFCPQLYLAPLSSIIVSSVGTKSFKPTLVMMSHIWASVCLLLGSIFCRTVPVKRIGSCGMIEIFLLKWKIHITLDIKACWKFGT